MTRRTSRKPRRSSRKRSSRTLRANGRPRVNREGMTFEQWYAAAGRPAPTLAGTKALVAAWDSCEDPAEYRVLLRRNARARKSSGKLRDMEVPMVLGYELDRTNLVPVRPALNLAPGDYGCDPVGPSPEGFLFRMVPSGDIVTEVEKDRRMKARGLRRNSKKTDAEAGARYKVEADRRRERDRAEKAQYAEIRRFTDEVERTLFADMGANQFQVYYRPGHLHLVRVGDRPSSNLKLAWQEPLSGFLDRDQRARLITDRLARVSWLGPDMIEREIVAAPAKPKASPGEYKGFRIEKSDPSLGGKPYYEIFYPDGGSKTVSTMKAARDYIDEYMGDA